MSSDKNIIQPERKKERTSVLEKIRRRTGLLVGIVGLALLIFILESLLGSGASIFGGNELSKAGTINGKTIDRNEFIMRFENQLNNYRQRNQGKEADEATRTQAVETIWQQYIIELVMKPQFEKVGIVVGEDELYEAVVVNPVETIIQNLTDPNTKKVNEQFSRPDGTLDPNKWRQAVQNVTGENEMAVRNMEEQVKSTRYFEKFRNLINKGLYVTTAETQAQFDLVQGPMNVSFVVKRYSLLSDSAVKLTENDIEKYYKDHAYEYLNTETSRKLEFITFNVLPSAADVSAIEKEAARVAGDLKGKTTAEDSVIMAQENENGAIIIQNLTKKIMSIRDSSVYTAAPGAVYGPYNEGAFFKIYKLEAVNSVADSARVRHILIGINDAETQKQKRSMPQAKREADSLVVLLKNKQANFDSLVLRVSDDFGSKTNGGDYGWYDEDKGFVDPFKYAGLMGTKGTTTVVETQFGYHIIEVLDVSKTRHKSFKVAQVMKLIAPSEETTQGVFAKANQFAGENNTAELFDKAAEKEKYTKRLADNLKEGDYQVPGVEGAKDMVKWAYTANKGDVSLFSFPDKFIVAKLSSIKNKGTLPLEEVREDVVKKATTEKKAEQFLAEFKSKAADAKTIQEVATKLGTEVLNQDLLMYMGGVVDALGHENALIGTAAGLKAGAMSKPVVGENGVFVVKLNSRKAPGEGINLQAQREEMETQLRGRSDYEVFNALKDVSDIEFHKSRID
ncbi:MAG: SurA N-terminal domain-containing protein [bacterium]|nr:SurA N-terminal domain-containing protein [bacterium]